VSLSSIGDTILAGRLDLWASLLVGRVRDVADDRLERF
jgi:hypothetical protein